METKLFSCSIGFILFYLFMLHEIGYSFGIRRHKRYSKENVCNVSLITMNLVDDCPRNNKTLQMRLKSKKCSDFPLCKGEPLVYHCVSFNGSLVEVCAPEGYIIGHSCPLFDEGLGRVIEDFNTPCKECPFQYRSEMSFMYPECENHTSKVNETVDVYKGEEVSTKPCLAKSKHRKHDNNCISTANSKFPDTMGTKDNVTELTSSNKEEYQSTPMAFILTAATVSFLLALSIIIYFCIKRRNTLKYQRDERYPASKEDPQSFDMLVGY